MPWFPQIAYLIRTDGKAKLQFGNRKEIYVNDGGTREQK